VAKFRAVGAVNGACADGFKPEPGYVKELKQYRPEDWNEILVIVTDDVKFGTCDGEGLEAALKVPATGPLGLEADRD